MVEKKGAGQLFVDGVILFLSLTYTGHISECSIPPVRQLSGEEGEE